MMAEFKEAYRKLIQLEFSNNPELFLHLNKNETGFTLGGIYELYNKEAIDWDFIRRVVDLCRGDIRQASRLLYWDKSLHSQVYTAFEYKYWKKHKLGQIHSQLIADEIIVSLVNIGGKAIKFAQQVVGVLDDGIIGTMTLEALNDFDELEFSKLFDVKEIENYNNIVKANPAMSINLAGWIARANSVSSDRFA